MTDSMYPLSVELLDRYLAGVCTAEETQVVQAWLAAHPEHARAARLLTEPGLVAPTAADPIIDTPNVDVAWARFERHAQEERKRLFTRSIETRRHVRVGGPRLWRWVSGSIAIAIVLGIITVRSRTPSRWVVAPHSVTTSAGQRKTVRLADGSQVTLAPQSRLTIAEPFGTDTRDVTLVGEAYLVVQSASHVPFVVHTGSVSTRVLGTRFDVRRYLTDRTTRVAVLSGRVVVSAAERPRTSHMLRAAMLDAGMIAEATDSSVTSGIVDDVARLSFWRDGQLVFHDDSVADVLTTLGHWFGVRFELSDSSLAAQHITAICDGRSLSDALMVLGTTLDVTSTIRDTVVTLRSGRGAHSERPAPRYRGRDLISQPREVGR